VNIPNISKTSLFLIVFEIALLCAIASDLMSVPPHLTTALYAKVAGAVLVLVGAVVLRDGVRR
jgi:hypothetical protein